MQELLTHVMLSRKESPFAYKHREKCERPIDDQTWSFVPCGGCHAIGEQRYLPELTAKGVCEENQVSGGWYLKEERG